MYPPPIIKIDSGNSSNSNISLLDQENSDPGIFNFIGLPPTEIKNFSALMVSNTLFLSRSIISK